MDRPSPENLCRWLTEELGPRLGGTFPDLEITFEAQASGVADGTAVLLLRDRTRTPRAVVLCSSPAAPDMMLRNATRARLAKQALGATLGAPILDPLAEGRVQGLSYVVAPRCDPLSESRPVWALQRALIAGPLLDWLWAATARTAADVPPGTTEAAFEIPLRHMASLTPLDARIRDAADAAAGRLASGAWVPRHALMHGDLWKGNVLVRPRGDAEAPAPWRNRFVIIDWPGSAVAGYAMLDLVRLALSFRISPRRLRAELRRHCVALGCAPEDAASHLLAALGHLALHLEHFPLCRFVHAAESWYGVLTRASR